MMQDFMVGDRVVLINDNQSWNGSTGVIVSTPSDIRDIGPNYNSYTDRYYYVEFDHIPNTNTLYGDAYRLNPTMIASTIFTHLQHDILHVDEPIPKLVSSLRRFTLEA
jgi:hypothetical protein